MVKGGALLKTFAVKVQVELPYLNRSLENLPSLALRDLSRSEDPLRRRKRQPTFQCSCLESGEEPGEPSPQGASQTKTTN